MPYLYYKQKAYGGTSTVNDSEHVIADNGSGSEITSQQLFENILGDLATVEESTTASKAYEVGDYIILNSYFYKVTSAIALGGTITVGTNVVKTTVGDEFKTFEFPVRELTKAQYNALPTAQQNDGTIYLITDGDGGWEAENSSYDNTESGLTATNVQDALDEVDTLVDNLLALKVVDLGVITDLNIETRSDGYTYKFSFKAAASNNPFGNTGGYGFLFSNFDSSDYGRQILISNGGIKTRALAAGAYQTWSTIV